MAASSLPLHNIGLDELPASAQFHRLEVRCLILAGELEDYRERAEMTRDRLMGEVRKLREEVEALRKANAISKTRRASGSDSNESGAPHLQL
jgi:hypothetical protein